MVAWEAVPVKFINKLPLAEATSMAKRRAPVQSDDEERLASSPASKRARTANSDDDPASPSPSPEKECTPNGNGNSKSRRTADNEEGDEGQNESLRDEDDDLFEEEHEAAIRAAIEAGRKAQGVRCLVNPLLSIDSFTSHSRVSLTMELLSPSRCINSCATSTSLLLSAPKSILSSVSGLQHCICQSH